MIKQKEGYKNSLYYPHHESVPDGDYTCYHYWLASPSAHYSGNVLYVTCLGDVGCDNYGTHNMGVRPVVSLNSGIKVNATNAE